NELIGGAKAASRQSQRRDRCKRLKFLCGVSAQVDLGALKVGVTEPKRDLADVSCRSKCVHCASPSKHMGRAALFSNRRLLRLCRSRVFSQDVRESRAGHRAAGRIEEQLGVTIPSADREPSLQGFCCLLPERENAFPPSLAHDVDTGAILIVELI